MTCSRKQRNILKYNKLKPCPFCGGEAIITYEDKQDFENSSCRCGNEKGCQMSAYIYTIKAWNTRAEVERDECEHEVKNTDCICVKCGACLSDDCDKKIEAMVKERDKGIREYLWLNHAIKGITCTHYGDDGEMQCCMIDFKRDSIEDILKIIYKRREEQAIQEYAEGGR